MSNERIRELLTALRNEVRETEIDPETRAALHTLDADIHALLDVSQQDPDAETLIDQARELEAQFALEHPTAERVMREVIDALVKIGV